MNKLFPGRVKEGKFEPFNRDAFVAEIQKHEGKRIELTIHKEKKTRSNPQNAYYHAVVIPLLMNESGFSHDEMHEALKVKFLTDFTGELPRVRSTTGLTTVEFMAFLEDAVRLGAEFYGINIPDPNQIDY